MPNVNHAAKSAPAMNASSDAADSRRRKAFAAGAAYGASLLAFMAGALFGGMINVRIRMDTNAASELAIEIEAILLLMATGFAASAGTKAEISPSLTYGLIVLMALAMGVRNAVVRKLAVPDLTTTVLTLTVTGIARIPRLPAAPTRGGEPELQRS